RALRLGPEVGCQAAPICDDSVAVTCGRNPQRAHALKVCARRGRPGDHAMHWRQRITHCSLIIIPALFLSLAPGKAFDRGQFENVPDNVRSWFKSVKGKNGIPCCDISDGHRTDYDVRENTYWVPIDGNWMQVPQDAVVNGAANPTGDAVVWYVNRAGNVII